MPLWMQKQQRRGGSRSGLKFPALLAPALPNKRAIIYSKNVVDYLAFKTSSAVAAHLNTLKGSP